MTTKQRNKPGPFRLPLWATLFTLAGMVILCALGTWQVKRLAWKNDLIAQINAARIAAPVAVGADDFPAFINDPHLLLRATITGRYLHQYEIMLKPRPLSLPNGGQRTGGHLVTPFLLSDGTTIIPVLRGWVSDDDDTFIQRPESIITITGTLRPPTKPNSFTPKNNADLNMWFILNPADIATAFKLDAVVPLAFYEQTNRDDVGWPLPVDPGNNPKNNHLQYAVFWFGMAALLGVMYVLRFIVYGRKGDDEPDDNGSAV